VGGNTGVAEAHVKSVAWLYKTGKTRADWSY
jgi:hypothetical protein